MTDGTTILPHDPDKSKVHEYRGYKIEWDARLMHPTCGWVFQHDDFDPTPMYADDPPSDNRYGYGTTLQDCKDQIDDLEGE